MIQKFRRLVAYMLFASMTFIGFAQPVQAVMIGTDQIAAANAAEENRAKVFAALERPEIVAQLEAFGVDKAEAEARVAALSDAELATMADRVDSLPAGAGVWETIVFIAVLLLITDILGFTTIYPFTRPIR